MIHGCYFYHSNRKRLLILFFVPFFSCLISGRNGATLGGRVELIPEAVLWTWVQACSGQWQLVKGLLVLSALALNYLPGHPYLY
jgi:hypothetical protein